jgi:hypothetical protein
MLGEYNDSSFLFPPDPESKVCNTIDNFLTTKHFDWPNDRIDRIKQVMGTPCSTPSGPEFKFELSEEATKQNLGVLEKYNFDLGRALEAQ